jgi:hypothetical protein
MIRAAPAAASDHPDPFPIVTMPCKAISPRARPEDRGECGVIRQRGTSVTLRTRFEAVVWVSGFWVFPTVERIPP